MTELLAYARHAGFVEKIGQCRDQLRVSERFLQQNAARHSLSPPLFRAIAGHVDYWDRGLKFPCTPRHIPTVFLSRHPNISKQGAEASSVRLKFGYRFLSGDDNERLKPSVAEDIDQRNADETFIFSDKDKLNFRTFQGGCPSGSDGYATKMLHTNPFVLRIRGHQSFGPYHTVAEVAPCISTRQSTSTESNGAPGSWPLSDIQTLPPQSNSRGITDEIIEAACAAHWPQPWPGDRSEHILLIRRSDMRKALSAALATTEGSNNG